MNRHFSLTIILGALVMSLLGGSNALANSLAGAVQIAKGFKSFHEKDEFPEWKDATVSNQYEIFSSNGILVGYEISFVSPTGEDRGYIMVSAKRGDAVVPDFSAEGPSISSELIRYYEEVLAPQIKSAGLVVTEVIFMGALPGFYAIGLKFDRHLPILDEIPNQDGWFIFSPFPESASLQYNVDSQGNRARSSSPEDGENDEFRKALINQDFSGEFFQKEDSGKIEGFFDKDAKSRLPRRSSGSGGTSKAVSGGFSKFYQENRAWSKGGLTDGTCHAGCSPVAWAILLEYWDRNGYPKMVSSDQDNRNTRTTAPDVRWLINELRGWLKTTCTSTDNRQGSTRYWYNTRGKYYAHQRGYKNFSASNNYFGPAWWELIGAVKANQPPIAMIDSSPNDSTDGMDHAAVVYQYKDRRWNANDYFRVRTGWSRTTNKWYNKKYLFGITRVYK